MYCTIELSRSFFILFFYSFISPAVSVCLPIEDETAIRLMNRVLYLVRMHYVYGCGYIIMRVSDGLSEISRETKLNTKRGKKSVRASAVDGDRSQHTAHGDIFIYVKERVVSWYMGRSTFRFRPQVMAQNLFLIHKFVNRPWGERDNNHHITSNNSFGLMNCLQSAQKR